MVSGTVPAKIMVLSDVQQCRVIILASCGLHERAAHCIKRSGRIRLQPTCPALARPAPSGWPSLDGRPITTILSRLTIRVLAPARPPLCGYAGTASKCVPSFQMWPSSAASLRATATRARFGPHRLRA